MLGPPEVASVVTAPCPESLRACVTLQADGRCLEVTVGWRCGPGNHRPGTRSASWTSPPGGKPGERWILPLPEVNTLMDTAAHARDLLAENRYVVIASAGADGSPWGTPVWFAPEGLDRILWMSWPRSHHSQLIASRSRIALTVFDSAAPRARPRPSTPPPWSASARKLIWMLPSRCSTDGGRNKASTPSVALKKPATPAFACTSRRSSMPGYSIRTPQSTSASWSRADSASLRSRELVEPLPDYGKRSTA